MTKEDEVWALIMPLVSVSVGGFVMSLVYMALNFIYTKIRTNLMCSITI